MTCNKYSPNDIPCQDRLANFSVTLMADIVAVHSAQCRNNTNNAFKTKLHKFHKNVEKEINSNWKSSGRVYARLYTYLCMVLLVYDSTLQSIYRLSSTLLKIFNFTKSLLG